MRDRAAAAAGPASGPAGVLCRALDVSRDRYVRIVAWLVRRLGVAFAVVALSIAGAYGLFVTIPTTLLPQEDQGAVFVDLQLPEAAALERTGEVMAQVRAILVPPSVRARAARPAGALRQSRFPDLPRL